MSTTRRYVELVLVALVASLVTVSAPAIADGVRHALFAHDSDKVDGKHAVGGRASRSKRKNKLVAANAQGYLPNDIVKRAKDAADVTCTGCVASNELGQRATLKVGTAAPTTYAFSGRRYIVEAPPSVVGQVIPLNNALTDELCRDKDGCELSLQMVNWNELGEPGAVASRVYRLFISATSRQWRLSDVDTAGLDDDGGLEEAAAFDCYFTDGESYLGGPNARSDDLPGFGLLNAVGGTYSDTTTTCRVVLTD